LEYGSSVAPGADGLALPEDLVQQDRLLDVPDHRGSACDQQGVELDGAGGRRGPLHDRGPGTRTAHTADRRDDQDRHAQLGRGLLEERGCAKHLRLLKRIISDNRRAG